MSAPERIVAAAMYYKGSIISVHRPGRHVDIIRSVERMGLDPVAVGYHQGFVTSDGRFVLRDEALSMARKAGQIGKRVSDSSDLFSEDVW